jgi:hypothetical protein
MSALLIKAQCGGHSPSGKFWLELIFFAHMNAMALNIFVGTKKIHMFHAPAGFCPLEIFWHSEKRGHREGQPWGQAISLLFYDQKKVMISLASNQKGNSY